MTRPLNRRTPSLARILESLEPRILFAADFSATIFLDGPEKGVTTGPAPDVVVTTTIPSPGPTAAATPPKLTLPLLMNTQRVEQIAMGTNGVLYVYSVDIHGQHHIAPINGDLTLDDGPLAGNPFGTLFGVEMTLPDGQKSLNALRNPANGESFDGVIWAEGNFDAEALARLNALMRDSHSGTMTRCDANLFDLLACVQTRVRKPFNIVSGFRSRQTNLALARHDPHVARNSFHIRGMAADFYVEGVAPRQLAQRAREVGAGGVGLYAGESFVHVDTGPMRSWMY